MRICCQDMFFARSRNTPLAQELVGGMITPGQTPLETAFRYSHSMTDKENVVSELVNLKVTGPVDVDFTNKVRVYFISVYSGDLSDVTDDV